MNSCKVLFLEKNEFSIKEITSINYEFPIEFSYLVPDVVERLKDQQDLEKIFYDGKPDFYFTFIAFLNEQYLNILELIKDLGIPIVIWQVDEPSMIKDEHQRNMILHAISLSSLYCINSLEYEDFYKTNKIRYLYLPVYGSNFFFNETIASSKNFKYDFSFVGLSNDYRKDYFERLKSYFSPGYSSVFETNVNFGEYKEIMYSTKINLSFGDAHPTENITGWSPTERLFRTPLAGSFILHDSRKHISDLLNEGTECVTFNSFSDCVEKIKFYMENEEERNKIIVTARKRILKEHMIQHRFIAIINKLRELNIAHIR